MLHINSSAGSAPRRTYTARRAEPAGGGVNLSCSGNIPARRDHDRTNFNRFQPNRPFGVPLWRVGIMAAVPMWGTVNKSNTHKRGVSLFVGDGKR
jgi:hypothetical protein